MDVAPERWGGWWLHASEPMLYLDDYRYGVELGTCTHSAEILDWVCQVAGKEFATDQVLAGLVRALDDILEPQERTCSMGVDRPARTADLLAHLRSQRQALRLEERS